MSLRKWRLLQITLCPVHQVYSHRKLILIAILLKNQNIDLKMMYDVHSDNTKINMLIVITLKAFFAWRGSYILFLSPSSHVYVIKFIASPLKSACWLLGLYKEDYLQIFKCVSFWLHNFCGWWEGCDPVNRLSHAKSGLLSFLQLTVLSWSAIVVLSKFLVTFLCCYVAFLFFCGWRGFVICLSQISSLFSCV